MVIPSRLLFVIQVSIFLTPSFFFFRGSQAQIAVKQALILYFLLL
uniref:Uncharacterized protein n=1 Tax=Rhizophora mucronata TaxID=61149 RepID=A0A2P2J9K4_RHIMU